MTLEQKTTPTPLSFSEATILQKSNLIMEQAFAMMDDNFFSTTGVFRLSPGIGEIQAIYNEIKDDPASNKLSQIKGLKDNPLNLSGIITQVNLQLPPWTGEAQAILASSINAEGFPKKFKQCIEELIDKGYVEEAKFLHNLLYVASMVTKNASQNKMKAYNMAVILAPTLDKLAATEPKVITEAPKVGLSVPLTNKKQQLQDQDPFEMHSFVQPFDKKYPKAAEELSYQHSQIPQRTKLFGINLPRFVDKVKSFFDTGAEQLGQLAKQQLAREASKAEISGKRKEESDAKAAAIKAKMKEPLPEKMPDMGPPPPPPSVEEVKHNEEPAKRMAPIAQEYLEKVKEAKKGKGPSGQQVEIKEELAQLREGNKGIVAKLRDKFKSK